MNRHVQTRDKSTPADYEVDFAQWLSEQAALLRAGRLSELDRENLAEEIESLGRSEKRELKRRLALLIQHLLKWEFQPGRRSESWRITISEQRLWIPNIIKDSPSLADLPRQAFEETYVDGRRAAINETGLLAKVFPTEPPFTVAQALNDKFFPGEPFALHDIIRD